MNYGLRTLQSKVQGRSTLDGAAVGGAAVILGPFAIAMVTGTFLEGLFSAKGSTQDIASNRHQLMIEGAVAAGLVGAGLALGGAKTAGFGRGLGMVGGAFGAYVAYQYTQFKAAGRI
jgi:hypothetical protein